MPTPRNPYYLRSGEDIEEDALSLAQEQVLEEINHVANSDSDTEDDNEDEMAQRVSLTNFNGEPSERGDLWWAYFDKFAALHNYNEDKKLDLLPFFLGKHARVWYDSLQEDQRGNLRNLKSAFINRFTSTAHDLDMYTLSQGIGESCTDYYSRCQQAMVGRQCPVDIQIMTVIRGLLPAIQPQVLLKAPKTMEETREAMLLTEMAASRFATPAPVAQILPERDQPNQALYAAIQDLTASVNAMGMPRDGPMRNREPESSSAQRPERYYRPSKYAKSKGKCGRCNSENVHHISRCPARGYQCSRCFRPDHFSDLCNAFPTNDSQQ